MIIHQRIAELRPLIRRQKREGSSVAVVPTMGNLHAGHLALVEKAVASGGYVIATIFVNPLQFGPSEDLDAYPRTPDADIALLEGAGCHCLFAPPVTEIYPRGLQGQTTVSVPGLTADYCGRSRPGHFQGVATVVAKLFNITTPDAAFFGLKDYQQYLVIRKMVEDLAFPVRLEGVETVREPDGLALSSRNSYLGAEDRRKAPLLYQQLRSTAELLRGGRKDFGKMESEASQTLEAGGFKPDYFRIANADNLLPAEPGDSRLVLMAAVWLGQTRLIDNIRLTLG